MRARLTDFTRILHVTALAAAAAQASWLFDLFRMFSTESHW